MMTSRLAALPLVALAALVIAGCGDSVAGTPAAQPKPTTTAVTASINPCALLTGSDIRQLGVVSQGADTLAGSRGCSWTKTGQYTVGFSVWDHVSINQIDSHGNLISNHRVGSHDGRQYQGANGGCAVSMAITSSSSIDVTVNGDPIEECQLADQFAVLIEPRLPAEPR